MTGKYNFPRGTRRQGYDNLPTHPHVLAPVVLRNGQWVDVLGAMWNSGKNAYWVHFSESERGWVPESDLMWLRRLL